MGKGFLYINVYVDNIAQPLKGANVRITGENTDITVTTNENGTSERVELNTVDKEFSLTPQTDVRPYETYNLLVTKEGFNPVRIEGVQIFDTITSYQDVFMEANNSRSAKERFIQISDITLWSNYDPSRNNILQGEQEISTPSPYVLPKTIIPEYVIVHDGIPSNTSAPNYYVPFPDYIKNVACSEIYSTWPRETLKANIYCIISFTLNRVYTEWYKSRGYSFTVTSSPAYDQKYTYGRTIFNSISNIVDEIFTEYIRKEGRSEPFLALYNDGINSNKPGWFSQWGSKDLGDKGYSALAMLKYYYGDKIYLATASTIEGLPTSFPGFNLKVGSCGEYVQKIQNELNYITGSYPGIPKIPNANGVFDENTKKTVEVFQKVFNLPITGIVDYATWYKISYIFIAVSKMIQGIYL